MLTFLAAAVYAVMFSQMGGIEGRVTVRQLPERLATRYAGAGGAASHPIKPLPAVVFVEGRITGAALSVRDPQMAQRDTAFQPALLAIPTSTTVRFPNDDKFFHNVFSYSKTKRFDLGRYPKGEAKSVTFDKPGTVAVFCEVHKWMRGAIVVLENPYYAIVGDDGSFSIPDVPAGTYKVAVWHPERGKKTFDVTVPANGNAQLNASF
ncbi:MAG: plastocyanin/azurin family copper-binding protein [Gemmatimonadota bacterium]